ncbi:hypothetical protein AAVH_23663, partial [Aphelenchoides avenae]
DDKLHTFDVVLIVVPGDVEESDLELARLCVKSRKRSPRVAFVRSRCDEGLRGRLEVTDQKAVDAFIAE